MTGPERHKWIDDGDGSCEVCGAEGGGSDAGRATAEDVISEFMASEGEGTPQEWAERLLDALRDAGFTLERKP